MPVHLQLNLLGGFTSTLNEIPIADFRTDKARALLTYLALEDSRPHPRQMLATLLWPEMNTNVSLKNLRLTLHRLRQSLDNLVPGASQQLFTVSRQTIQIQKEHVSTDVDHFRDLITTTETHTHHLHECETCLSNLVEAAELYRGELLAGFGTDNAQTFEDWLLVWREELHQQRLSVLHNLALTYKQRRAFKQALDYANRLLASDTFYEAGYQQVMEILAASGRRSEALQVYKNCRQLFLSQLGVEPSASTTALYEQIRDQQTAVIEEATATPPTTQKLYDFPTQLTPFYGREAQLYQLKTLLLAAEFRLVTLIGPGGIGKTRLGVETANHLAKSSHFTDGIYFFSLAAVDTKEALLTTLLTGLQLKILEQKGLSKQLVSYLQDKQCLLVLDNFEQLVAEAVVLNDILAAAPQVRLLVTSRFALNIRAEHRILLPGLAFPQANEPEQAIAANSSVRLFVESARNVAPHFRLTRENQTAVIEICQLVNGLPLALEIAGSWARLMDEATIAAQIRQNIAFLSTPMKDLPDRHRSMTAVFAYSWNLLSPSEQMTLAQLSVFRGGFSMQTAVSITDAPLGTLANLLDYSLLQRMANGRYEMHELTRQFAEQKFATLPNGQETETKTRNRHSDYYLTYLAQSHASLYGATPHLTTTDLQKRWQNILTAWQWAVSQQRWSQVRQSIDTLAYCCVLSGLIHEGMVLFANTSQQLQAMTKLTSPDTFELLGKMRLWHGHFLYRQGLVDEAITAVQTVQTIANTHNLPDLQMQALRLLASIKELQGDYQTAQAYLQNLATYYKQQENQQALADAYGSLGYLSWRRSQYAEAIAYLEKGLILQRKLNNVVGQSRQINILGLVYQQQGNLAASDSHFRQALVINQTLGYHDGIAKNLANLSIVLRQQGHYTQALTTNLEAEAAFQKIGHKEGVALLAGNRGIIHQSLGHLVEAAACFEQALQLDEQLGNQAGIARHLGNWGYLLQIQQQYQQAMACYDRAIPILRELGSAYFLATPLLHKAEILLAQGDYQNARQLGQEGLQLAEQVARNNNTALGYIILAQIAYAQGEAEVAKRSLTERLAHSQDDELAARFHYELWRMGAGTAHAKQATALYTNLYSHMPDYEYKVRLEELRKDA